MWTNFRELDVVKFCHRTSASRERLQNQPGRMGSLRTTGSGTCFWEVPVSTPQCFSGAKDVVLLKVHALYRFPSRIMRSSLYNAKCGMLNDRVSFPSPPPSKKASSVLSQFKDPVCEFNRLNTLAGFPLQVTRDSCVVDDFWGAVCKTGRTPVSGIGIHSYIHGNASFSLPLSLPPPFSSYNSKNKVFLSIWNKCYKIQVGGSGNKQVLLCLFIMSTSNISTFNLSFVLTEDIYLFIVSHSCKYLSFLVAISNFCSAL